jgi:hypothetical protein
MSDITTHVRRRAVAVILLASGCARGEKGGDAAFEGFMVLSAKAGDFGLTPGDTLMERPAGRVPAALREEVEREVHQVDYELGCTRYFSSGSVTVVFAAKSCTNPRRDLHDFGLALFRQEGDRFVRDGRSFSALATVCPIDRDKRGRPLIPCR